MSSKFFIASETFATINVITNKWPFACMSSEGRGERERWVTEEEEEEEKKETNLRSG